MESREIVRGELPEDSFSLALEPGRLGHTPPFVVLDFEVLADLHACVNPDPVADEDVEYPLIPPAL